MDITSDLILNKLSVSSSVEAFLFLLSPQEIDALVEIIQSTINKQGFDKVGSNELSIIFSEISTELKESEDFFHIKNIDKKLDLTGFLKNLFLNKQI